MCRHVMVNKSYPLGIEIPILPGIEGAFSWDPSERSSGPIIQQRFQFVILGIWPTVVARFADGDSDAGAKRSEEGD
jgi:hypothetical protein